MLQFNGRPVAWFGVGAPDVIGPGIAALQAAFAQYRSPRITNPNKAVADLQAAGNAAVSVVGPAIDALSGGSPDVMKRTQLVWQKNGELANITGATGSDVEMAKGIVHDMIDAYQQAASLAASLASKTVPRGSAPPPRLPGGSPPASDAPQQGGFLDWFAENTTTVLLVSGAVVVVGGVALAAAARTRATA